MSSSGRGAFLSMEKLVLEPPTTIVSGLAGGQQVSRDLISTTRHYIQIPLTGGTHNTD